MTWWAFTFVVNLLIGAFLGDLLEMPRWFIYIAFFNVGGSFVFFCVELDERRKGR